MTALKANKLKEMNMKTVTFNNSCGEASFDDVMELLAEFPGFKKIDFAAGQYTFHFVDADSAAAFKDSMFSEYGAE